MVKAALRTTSVITQFTHCASLEKHKQQRDSLGGDVVGLAGQMKAEGRALCA